MNGSLETARLILREWRDADREPFARLNADAWVMEYLGGVLTRAQSDAMVDRMVLHHLEVGFTLFAAELRESGELAGFIGLARPSFTAHFTPCVEIGWRLRAEVWGRGLATEGARKVMEYAFDQLLLDELVSFTAAGNLRSRRVMEKLGMTHDARDDFDHPRLSGSDPLRRHVLYRIQRGTTAR